MKLVIGFITYNNSTVPYLPYFLVSLKEALDFSGINSYQVCYVDNSDPDNAENKKIIEQFQLENSLNIKKIDNSSNLGFAAAYNKMIDYAVDIDAEYFMVINPDTVLTKESIWLLLEPLITDKTISATIPRLMMWNFEMICRNNKIDSLGIARKKGLKFYDICQGEEYVDDDKECKYKTNYNALAPSGAAGLFRISDLKKIAEEIGGRKQYYDERFFMYKEDCDLAYRMSQNSLKSYLVLESIIFHDRTTRKNGSKLFDVFVSRKNKSRQAKKWSFRNQHFIFIKHFKQETFLSKILVVGKILAMFIFSLILEQYLLKEYKNIYQFYKNSKK